MLFIASDSPVFLAKLRFLGQEYLFSWLNFPTFAEVWGKEDELKQLKSELAALDRKISAELAPKHDENDGTEVKQEQSTQPQTEVKAETTVNTVNVHTTDPPQGHKPSMVAEPFTEYNLSNRTSKANFSLSVGAVRAYPKH